MRVLTVGNMYPPLHEGGYELVWEAAVSYLRRHGHEVRVLASDHRRGDAGAAEEADVHRELRWYWHDHAFPRLSARERLALEVHNHRVLRRHLRELRPDVVCWWAMGGMSMSLIERVRRQGPPAACVVCDDWLLYGPDVDGWTRALATRPRLGRIASALTGIPAGVDLTRVGPCLFPSETTRSRAVRRLGLAQTAVCHQGVGARMFAPAPARPWRWRLLCAGRLDPRKGLRLAIGSLAHLPPQATLTIAGSGDEGHRAELERQAEELGARDRVRFTTRTRGELRELYAEADALLFPILWKEPWGLVPLEAMSVGRPVIATGRGGSGEYLRDEHNCLIFDPEAGPSALASAVDRLAAEPGLRNRLREGGFETVARLPEDRFNEAVADLLERARASAQP